MKLKDPSYKIPGNLASWALSNHSEQAAPKLNWPMAPETYLQETDLQRG